eukprot:67721-Chlamydomonas_euryale.AAC.1
MGSVGVRMGSVGVRMGSIGVGMDGVGVRMGDATRTAPAPHPAPAPPPQPNTTVSSTTAGVRVESYREQSHKGCACVERSKTEGIKQWGWALSQRERHCARS